MCSSRKYSYSPHKRGWKFQGGWGSERPKNLKHCMKLNWNFQRGGRVIGQIPSVGGVWIFSGTTQLNTSINELEVFCQLYLNCNYNTLRIRVRKPQVHLWPLVSSMEVMLEL